MIAAFCGSVRLATRLAAVSVHALAIPEPDAPTGVPDVAAALPAPTPELEAMALPLEPGDPDVAPGPPMATCALQATMHAAAAETHAERAVTRDRAEKIDSEARMK